MTKLTNGLWELKGPIYPSYSTALRTIRWIGQKAEEILFKSNVRSVEMLYSIILRNSRNYAHVRSSDSDYLKVCTFETLYNLIGTNLPIDNIHNIADVISESVVMMSYTFVSSF